MAGVDRYAICLFGLLRHERVPVDWRVRMFLGSRGPFIVTTTENLVAKGPIAFLRIREWNATPYLHGDVASVIRNHD